MDALHDQNFALAKLHKFTAVLTLARHEVVIGQFYFFPAIICFKSSLSCFKSNASMRSKFFLPCSSRGVSS